MMMVLSAALLTAALTREAGAAMTMITYWAWETTLRLLGGARGPWAPTGEEMGGAYRVATRTACFSCIFVYMCLSVLFVH